MLMCRVLTAFGVPDTVVAVERVGRAWSNRMWSVRTTGGNFAVKEMLNPWNDPFWREWLDEAISFEHAAVTAGVQAPRLVLTPAGEALVDVEGRTFRVHEWVTDAVPCPDGPVSPDVARAVARDLATMHALRAAPAHTGVFPVPTTTTCDGWTGLVTTLRQVGSPYADAAEFVAPDIAVVRSWFDQRPATEGRQVMSHGDVDQKNLLLAGGTPWLVDWDVAAPWVPAEEALRTALPLADWSEPAVVRAFLASYAEAGGEVVEPARELLGVDLIIGIDWLDRCLRIAAGLQDADPRRVDQARAQAPRQLREIHDQVAIATHLPRWLSDRSP